MLGLGLWGFLVVRVGVGVCRGLLRGEVQRAQKGKGTGMWICTYSAEDRRYGLYRLL